MSNTQNSHYMPDHLVTPGEVLDDYLESQGMTQTELATRTGLSKKTINGIVKTKVPISHETALRFERTLGRPAHFWNNLERQFQEDRIRLAEKERMKSYLEWLKRIPVNAMTNLGWIPKQKEKLSQLETVLGFFGVASPEQWQMVWQDYQVAYRQTQRIETRDEPVFAWLRKGEIEARKIMCASFDRIRFQEVLEEVRQLTRETPDVFEPKLIDLAAAAGVAVVFVPELPKTGVFGATRWLRGKAVIQLSLRYKSNDHLWFTFFHEAGHILKHGRKEIFLEGNGLDGKKEEEANSFARDKLIPPASFRRFLDTWDGRSHGPIRVFAENIGIAPGIVVGRLQFEDRLPKSHGNGLKVFYRWSRTQ